MARQPPSSFVEKELRTTGSSRPLNSFGTRKARAWQVPEGATDLDLQAARLQHDVALKLRDEIGLTAGGSISEWCRVHELSYEHVRDVLSGDQWMRLDELVRFADLLGLDLTLEIRDRPESGA